MRNSRRVAAFIGTIAVLLALAAPASARSSAVVDEMRMAAARQSSVGVSPAPCDDRGYKLLGARLHTTYRWSFKASSTPAGLSKASVAAVLQRSFSNITNERNDCGRGDSVSATHQYLGKTTASPNCNSRDHVNVVGFGRLPLGVLAVTCYWISGGRIVEADIKINSRESWALSPASCHDDVMLEATITHEAGHVFGLDHIGERRHGRLTMSPYLDGPCENDEASLGLGDMLALESLY